MLNYQKVLIYQYGKDGSTSVAIEGEDRFEWVGKTGECSVRRSEDV